MLSSFLRVSGGSVAKGRGGTQLRKVKELKSAKARDETSRRPHLLRLANAHRRDNGDEILGGALP